MNEEQEHQLIDATYSINLTVWIFVYCSLNTDVSLESEYVDYTLVGSVLFKHRGLPEELLRPMSNERYLELHPLYPNEMPAMNNYRQAES